MMAFIGETFGDERVALVSVYERWIDDEQTEILELERAVKSLGGEEDRRGYGEALTRAKQRLAEKLKDLEIIRDGMIPIYSFLDEAIAEGAIVPLTSAPHKLASAGSQFIPPKGRDFLVEESIGRSCLAAAEELEKSLIEAGADAEVVKRFADYVFSAGRYCERIALRDFENDVRLAKRTRRAQSKRRKSELTPDELATVQAELKRRVRDGASRKAAAKVISDRLLKGDIEGIDRPIEYSAESIRKLPG